jgi:hypothetical protein
MNRAVLLATTAAVAVLSGGAPVVAKPVHWPTTVLWNQNSNFGHGVVSMNFTSGSFTSYDAAAADDFVIPAGEKWRITGVDATGVYFNGSGPATSEVITFYADSHGRPGKAKVSYTLNCTDSGGSFACDIPGGVKLSGGTARTRYWLSVVANMDFHAAGEWGWVENTNIRHFQAMWENPGLCCYPCWTWATLDYCFGWPGDLAFDLRGKRL